MADGHLPPPPSPAKPNPVSKPRSLSLIHQALAGHRLTRQRSAELEVPPDKGLSPTKRPRKLASRGQSTPAGSRRPTRKSGEAWVPARPRSLESVSELGDTFRERSQPVDPSIKAPGPSRLSQGSPANSLEWDPHVTRPSYAPVNETFEELLVNSSQLTEWSQDNRSRDPRDGRLISVATARDSSSEDEFLDTEDRVVTSVAKFISPITQDPATHCAVGGSQQTPSESTPDSVNRVESIFRADPEVAEPSNPGGGESTGSAPDRVEPSREEAAGGKPAQPGEPITGEQPRAGGSQENPVFGETLNVAKNSRNPEKSQNFENHRDDSRGQIEAVGGSEIIFREVLEAETEAAMAELYTNKCRTTVKAVVALYSEDYEDLEFDSVTIDHVRLLTTEAVKKKADLATAMLHLDEHDAERYAREIEAQATDTRRGLARFIKDSQKYLRELEDKKSEPRVDSRKESILAIKVARVNSSKDSALNNLETLSEEMSTLIVEDQVYTNVGFREVEDQHVSLLKHYDGVVKDAKEIYNDAVEGGLAEIATSLEGKIRSLSTLKIKNEMQVQAMKRKMGIVGRHSDTKHLDLKVPTFSGTGESVDVFTFKDDFELYMTTKALSNADQLTHMQKVCLTGGAKTACENFKTLEEVWTHLMEMWGNAKQLFRGKVTELRKLGRCIGPPTKQREWALSVKNKLDFLLALAKKHDLLTDFYYCPIISEIQNALPPKVLEDFKKDLMKAMKERPEAGEGVTKPLAQEEVALALIKYMEVIIEALNFEVHFALTNCLTSDPSKKSDNNTDRRQQGGPPPRNNPGSQTPRPKTFFNQFDEEEEVTEEDEEPRKRRPRNRNKNKNAAYPANTGGSKPGGSQRPQGQRPQGNPNQRPQGPAQRLQPQGGQRKPQPNQARRTQPAHAPEERVCELCTQSHTHLHYCVEFQGMDPKQRYYATGQQNVCFRCLRMDSGVDFNNKQAWFEGHKADCTGDWVCTQGGCSPRDENKQTHFLLCNFHKRLNKDVERDFIKAMDQTKIQPGLRFFHFKHQIFACAPSTLKPPDSVDSRGLRILPDIAEPAIFMIQHVSVEADKEVVIFYDTGCNGGGLSERGAGLMETETVRPGPTMMEVAGGRTIKINGGEERFWLDTADGETKATFNGLLMPEITSPFPVWDLSEAYKDLEDGYGEAAANIEPLPKVPKRIGGRTVDVMIGSRYLKYFPVLIFSLPSGLSIFKSCFRSSDGSRGILGGPHKAWAEANAAANVMGYRTYLTMEARAYNCQSRALNFKVSRLEAAVTSSCLEQILEEDEPDRQVVEEIVWSEESSEPAKCEREHCRKHSQEDGWQVPASWDLSASVYSIKTEESKFESMERLGAETEYRCVRCRNCNACRNGDHLEAVSLEEETEQSMIEEAVTYDAKNKVIVSILPFKTDPALALTDNMGNAKRVLDQQMKLIEKNPEMRQDILKSHEKLRSRGYVKKLDELSRDEMSAFVKGVGPGYIIPWRTVYNPHSLSTPCRMVFDASQATPGGLSLNAILPKGKNKLGKILDIMLRFRRKPAAFTSDISMAYNGLLMRGDYLKYQQYLWREDLDMKNPVVLMVICTVIYGVKPAGNLTIAGFHLLAEYCILHHPEHALGALVLALNAYMDDLLHSEDDMEKCITVAESLKFTLALGSLEVKAITFSGQPPPEKVSSDGVHVGLLGLRWDTEADLLSLDVKPLALGKAKRGVPPPLVEGDIATALKGKFTRRIVTGRVAGIYDPPGLVTPVTAKYKLDLSELSARQLDWDDQIPDIFLEKWVKNLEDMQKLREVKFRRTIIPEDAVNLEVEVITSVDASKDIAMVAVHTRVLRKNGKYHVQLFCAKSKRVHSTTVPKAELKAATMGAVLTHTVKLNLGEQFRKVVYVGDSTVALYWIHQDQRPLHTTIRNCVIEIRRFSQPHQWYHVPSADNVADIGTRPVEIEEIMPGSPWQNGYEWMSKPWDEMDLQSIQDVSLNAAERREASVELRGADVGGIVLSNFKSKVSDRYQYSEYLVDPCSRSWPRVIRVMAMVIRFIIKRVPRFEEKYQEAERQVNPGAPVRLEDIDIRRAERYFFLKGTMEVRQFMKPKEYVDTVEKDDVLYYNSRILSGASIKLGLENTSFDLSPLHFVRPVLDRYSPIAFSIMIYCHQEKVRHRNSVETLRSSRDIAFIFGGRDLAKEVRERCVHCRRFRASLVEAEMATIHESRLTIAPPFFNAMVDLLGPYEARCEHHHRSTVKVWGVVFKDPATGAIAVYCMPGYSTECFMQAYTRFAAKHGHPNKLFIDQGSQLVKAAEEMELVIVDVQHQLESKFQVGIEYQVCPVTGHSHHGLVERSIREVKKLFDMIYNPLKLDIMSYETAFHFIANELNNLPFGLGSKSEDLGSLDLLTPNRLLLGRNNQRALGGYADLAKPSRLLKQNDEVWQAWWAVWEREKLMEYIPRPARWRGARNDLKVGDIVIFLKEDKELTFGAPVWKIGELVEVQKLADGVARTVVIKYKNSTENTFRTTKRCARKIAVLHSEGDLELVDELAAASKEVDVQYILRGARSAGGAGSELARLHLCTVWSVDQHPQEGQQSNPN